MRILLFLLTLILLAGCRTTQETIDTDQNMLIDDDIPTIHGTWELREISEEQVDVNSFMERLPFVQFDLTEGRFSGFGGCNQIGGNFRIEHHNIDLYDITATRMHCGDDNREPEFLALLNEVEFHGVDKERLLLSTEENGSLLFRRVSD